MSGRLDRMRANPRADWRMADVEAVCREHGALVDPPRGGGSHFKVHAPGMRDYLTVPSRRPIKPVYIKQLVHFLDELRRRNAQP